jgi:hypothetical protein
MGYNGPMAGKTHGMPIPPRPSPGSPSVDIARVWAAEGELHVSLTAEVWEDPAAWGIMLVDLARQVAEAYERSRGISHQQALARLREGFDDEWGNLTDEPRDKAKR